MLKNNQIDKSKLDNLINAVFAESVTVYEAYSDFDKRLKTFKATQDVLSYIEEKQDKKCDLVFLSLHYAETRGFVYEKTINLNAKKVKHAQKRYSINGWGLISFQLWLEDNGYYCDINANSEKRAIKWQETYPDFKSVDLWNWKAVAKQNRRLKRALKQCLLDESPRTLQ